MTFNKILFGGIAGLIAWQWFVPYESNMITDQCVREYSQAEYVMRCVYDRQRAARELEESKDRTRFLAKERAGT